MTMKLTQNKESLRVDEPTTRGAFKRQFMAQEKEDYSNIIRSCLPIKSLLFPTS